MTRLGAKVRVIPLDPGRLARVEEQVLAAARESGRPAPARPRRSAAIAWTAAGAALAAAVALLVVGRAAPADRTPARVDLGDASILLTPGSRAAVGTRPDGARVIELASGRVDCEVEPRPGRAPFVVRAGDVTVEVVGTVFSVERPTRGDDVVVSVSRGVVRVAAPGRAPVKVTAGQSWSRRADEVVASSGSQPNPSPEGEHDVHGAQDRLAAGGAAGPGAPARPGASGADHGAGVAASPGAANGTDGAGGPGPGDRGTDGEGSTGGRATDGEGSTGGRATDGEGSTGGRGTDGARGGPDDRAGGSRAGIRGARTGARAGRPGTGTDDPDASNAAAPADLPPLTCEDVDLCRRAALGSVGPSAGEALYSLIYIELFREKDPGQAITLAELYERRFARRRAREAEAVLWLRVIAHGAAGEAAGRREAARRYLDRYPRGRFSPDAARLLDE